MAGQEKGKELGWYRDWDLPILGAVHPRHEWGERVLSPVEEDNTQGGVD